MVRVLMLSCRDTVHWVVRSRNLFQAYRALDTAGRMAEWPRMRVQPHLMHVKPGFRCIAVRQPP